MAKNVNAVVMVDVQNLHTPLATFQARQLASFTAEFRGIPDEIQGVGVVVYLPNGDHFLPVQASQDANGEWKAYFTPIQFKDVGEAKYEVVGTDENGGIAPLGSGRIVIDPFGSGGAVVPEGKPIAVTEIPDQNGVAHKIRAVNTAKEGEEPNWTSIVEV